MESAIFGLIGVVVGSLLSGAKEWWFLTRVDRKADEYLCIRVATQLERFVDRCAEVVGDDGLGEDGFDENGCRQLQVPAPTLELDNIDVEWKSLPANLMYQVLNLPSKIRAASHRVSAEFEHNAGPPDYEEGFEERQLQYAVLGIEASVIAGELRKYAKLPSERAATGMWDPVDYMQERKARIELVRNKRAENPLAE